MNRAKIKQGWDLMYVFNLINKPVIFNGFFFFMQNKQKKERISKNKKDNMFVGKNKLHMLSIAPTTQTPTKKVSNISYLTPFSILRTREYPIVRNIKEIIKYNNKEKRRKWRIK